MSGCLDRISCECCECCTCDCEPVKEWLSAKRNMFASTISGALFAMGWWFVIDATVNYAQPIYAAFFICGIFSTIALLMINSISTGQIMGDTYTEGCLGRRAARAWLFVGFLFAFGGLIGSLWIFIQEFLVPAVENTSAGSSNSTTTMPMISSTPTVSPTMSPSPSSVPSVDVDPMHIWQGIAFFAQNLFIFASTLVYKFGRTEEDNSW